MAQQEQSDGGQRRTGEASKFLRGSARGWREAGHGAGTAAGTRGHWGGPCGGQGSCGTWPRVTGPGSPGRLLGPLKSWRSCTAPWGGLEAFGERRRLLGWCCVYFTFFFSLLLFHQGYRLGAVRSAEADLRLVEREQLSSLQPTPLRRFPETKH